MSEQTDQNQTAEQPPALNKDWGDVIVIALVAALIICLGFISYNYFYRKGGNSSAISGKVTSLQQQVMADQEKINQLQQALQQLQVAAQQTQALTAKQEQIIEEWQTVQKGDMGKWYMAEAQYLVRLANDHAQYTHNIPMALTLLQRADQVLLPMQESSAIEIRQSIAGGIATLQSLPQINVAELYAKLASLDAQFDQLPLISVPVQPEPAVTNDEKTGSQSWWKAGLTKTLQALQKIVVIRHSSVDALPLVMPEERSYLYLSLHAEMQNAMWAALHHQPQVFQTSIDRQIAWIKQYFMQDAPATQAMLNQLTSIRNLDLQPQTANLTGVLQLFNNYFSRTGAV